MCRLSHTFAEMRTFASSFARVDVLSGRRSLFDVRSGPLSLPTARASPRSPPRSSSSTLLAARGVALVLELGRRDARASQAWTSGRPGGFIGVVPVIGSIASSVLLARE